MYIHTRIHTHAAVHPKVLLQYMYITYVYECSPHILRTTQAQEGIHWRTILTATSQPWSKMLTPRSSPQRKPLHLLESLSRYYFTTTCTVKLNKCFNISHALIKTTCVLAVYSMYPAEYILYKWVLKHKMAAQVGGTRQQYMCLVKHVNEIETFTVDSHDFN